MGCWVPGRNRRTCGDRSVAAIQETSQDSDLELIYRSEPIFTSRVAFLETLPCSLSECSALFSLSLSLYRNIYLYTSQNLITSPFAITSLQG